MECDGADNSGVLDDLISESRSALNSTILEYYKKFGRNRDLEQYFSLSTAQSEIRDPTSLFWRRMKSQTDSSDSGDKNESSTEICRISIKCSVPDPSSSQDENPKTKSDSESPPIITEDIPNISRNSDDESVKSDDNLSRKSLDANLDTSANKPFSPTSSITSQRKLEWDSLADVGYANESDRKTSGSSLSTLERLALKQHYSNNNTKQDTELGPPTAHSTPLDPNEAKSKTKKGSAKKTTKIYKKDVDFVEVNVPHNSEASTSQAINVNLTKHISFNVEKDGAITIDNMKSNVSVSPEKVSVETEVTPQIKLDKEIQTSLTKTKEKSSGSLEKLRSSQLQKVPILISLNTLRKRNRRRKLRTARRKLRNKKKLSADLENQPAQEKSGDQLSEAESFEYMPGHIYNQNHMKVDQSHSNNTAGNKSSLESSGAHTTDSSKTSRYSFTKDLEKSIDLLKIALQKRYDDSNVKKKLIKEVVQKLLKSKYRDDDSTTEFLSGLSFSSKKIGVSEGNHTTTSTSDANTSSKTKVTRPKKSILRVDKFNANAIATTSQSAPNLPSVSNSEKPITSNLVKPIHSSNTESDVSSKGKLSSDALLVKTSSEELYQKYLEALKREEAYKKHLRDKELFLRQKLSSSDAAFKVPQQHDIKTNKRLNELIKDLTRNNYDDGSGDASKLEGGSSSNIDFDRCLPIRNQRSHSVFTLSSGNSDCQGKKANLKKRLQNEIKDSSKPGTSKEGHCCCHESKSIKIGVTDSSVQVNMKYNEKEGASIERKRTESPKSVARVVSDKTGDIKYVCLCNEKEVASHETPDNFLIYKCSRLMNRGIQLEETCSKMSNTVSVQCSNITPPKNDDYKSSEPNTSKAGSCRGSCKSSKRSEGSESEYIQNMKRTSKSSQTNINQAFKMECGSNEKKSNASSCCDKNSQKSSEADKKKILIHETTRWIQTEISINPRISDPSLADINIINDEDCVKIISEQYRQVSKHGSEVSKYEERNEVREIYVGGEDSGRNVASDDSSDDRRICRKGTVVIETSQKCDKEIQSNMDQVHQNGGQQSGVNKLNEVTDNFTIPIQGTNMTLMVRIGSEGQSSSIERSNRVVSEAVVTDKAKLVEKATSLREECTKGVQSPNTNIFTEINKTASTSTSPRYPECNYNTSNTTTMKQNINVAENNSFKKTYYVNSCRIERNPAYNTYPKHVQVNERKPFLRSNTDTGNLGKSVCIETENNEDKQDKTVPQFTCATQVEETSCEITSSDERDCGCPKSSQCKGKCGQEKCGQRVEEIPKEKVKDVSYDERECGCPKWSQCLGKCGQRKCGQMVKDTPEQKDNEVLSDKEECGCSKSSQCKGKCGPGKCGQTRDEMPKQKVCKVPLEQDDCGCSKSAQCLGKCGQEKCRQTHEEEIPIQKLCEVPFDKEECGCPISAQCFGKCKQGKCGQRVEKIPKQQACKVPSGAEECGCSESAKCLGKCGQGKCGQIVKEMPNLTEDPILCQKSGSDSEKPSSSSSNDPIMDMIQNITKRYSKKDAEKGRKKKCFKEIMTVLNYLLDTEDSTDHDQVNICEKSTPEDTDCGRQSKKSQDKSSESESCVPKKYVDKGVQLSAKKGKCTMTSNTESSDVPASSELPGTSSDSATCKVLNKIKKECEKYHQKRCKSSHNGSKKCEASSSTSISCEQCRRVHHCPCRSHKCKGRRATVEKIKKKCVAYNLIIQTSDSVVSEEPPCDKSRRQLQNIIVKVPSKRKQIETAPFKEVCSKIEKGLPRCSPRCEAKCHRSRSLPNDSEISSTDDFVKRSPVLTVQDYLEKNRPDFVEKASQRQDCLKFISESRPQDPCATPRLKMVVVHTPKCTRCMETCNMYCGGMPSMNCNSCIDPYMQVQNEVTTIANERITHRQLLSLQLDRRPELSALSECELRKLAKEVGVDLRRKKPAPKFISEREMKKHSEKIYKSLPEVVQKKEEMKKENIKKTNLLMASIFKKNLQKKTLQGAVNLSNYSTVIKI